MHSNMKHTYVLVGMYARFDYIEASGLAISVRVFSITHVLYIDKPNLIQ